MNSFTDMFRPLSQRIKEAQEHMKFHGGQDQGLWPFQSFSISVEELLAAANGTALFSFGSIQENLKEAYRHVLSYHQENDALWPYQSFSMTIGELLEAAIMHFDPNFISQAQQKDKDMKEQYEKFKQDVYHLKVDNKFTF